MTPVLWSVGSVVAVSVASLAGVALLSFGERTLRRTLLYFVSFAAGAMFGNVFLHLLPEIVEGSADVSQGFLWVIVGIVLSFIVEKFIHWRHCHTLDCEDHHDRPIGAMVLIGDAAHNVLDGVLIASTFLVSVPLGIATTLAVVLHEIPQEIGDFGVLLHGGYSRARALFLNFCSGLTALVGALLVLFVAGSVEHIEAYLLPITAGNFLYIAGADLLPELHRETRLGKAFVQFFWLILGVALMYGLTQWFDPHAAAEHDDGETSLEIHAD